MEPSRRLPPSVRVLHAACRLTQKNPGAPIRSGILARVARTDVGTVTRTLLPLVHMGYLRASGRKYFKFWAEAVECE